MISSALQIRKRKTGWGEKNKIEPNESITSPVLNKQIKVANLQLNTVKITKPNKILYVLVTHLAIYFVLTPLSKKIKTFPTKMVLGP